MKTDYPPSPPPGAFECQPQLLSVDDADAMIEGGPMEQVDTGHKGSSTNYQVCHDLKDESGDVVKGDAGDDDILLGEGGSLSVSVPL